MIILKCKKSLYNACVDMEIKCKDENQLKAVFDWIMEENMNFAPKWVFSIESIEQEQETPWVCTHCGVVVTDKAEQMYDADNNKICRECHNFMALGWDCED